MSGTHASAAHLYEGGFLGVLAHKQSYLNILYLLLSFPLGLAYFVFLVTGLSLGFGLVVIVIGLFILLVMLAAVRGLASWERMLGDWLLGVKIPPPDPRPEAFRHPLIALKKYVTDSYTWKSLLYLLAKFPLGICSFVLTVFLVGLTATLLLAPLLYHYVQFHVFVWRIAAADEALICLAAGLVLAILSVHLLNLIAIGWRVFAVWALSGPTFPRNETRSGPIVIP